MISNTSNKSISTEMSIQNLKNINNINFDDSKKGTLRSNKKI